jgi:hypothetical protein
MGSGEAVVLDAQLVHWGATGGSIWILHKSHVKQWGLLHSSWMLHGIICVRHPLERGSTSVRSTAHVRCIESYLSCTP